MIKPEMRITHFLLDVDASWLTLPVFIGVTVLIAFVAIAVAFWNAATDEDDEPNSDD